MSERTAPPKQRRRDWVIILIILLLGFLCVIIAGQWAIRFSPTWKLDTNMASNLDPNSDFLTNRPVNYIEPLDPSILTQPVWVNVFLTPGALFDTRTPAPTVSAAPITPQTTITAAVPTQTSATTTITATLPVATKTSPYIPQPTLTPTPIKSVDLRITKTDGATTYTDGSTITYTIVVSNNGPSNVTGATVSDGPKPSQITTWGWCVAPCTPTVSSATNLSTTVNIASGASVTYTVRANISPSATGTLTNSASVNAPLSYVETDSNNNSATDTDSYVPSTISVDLGITKTDGATTYTVGSTVTYTIVVSNNGPNNVTGATVSDGPKPPQITTWGWCVAPCTPTVSNATNLSTTVNIASGASVTYTVLANIDANATGNLSNTASVNAPLGYTDTNSSNNIATDPDTPVFNLDLQITKDDGVTTYIPGSSVTYTIIVSNAGPANVTGATVADTFSSSITATWTCLASTGASCTASGSGSINDIVDIPVSGSLTYTVNASIASSASGVLSNMATVTAPSGYTDTNPANNSATDNDNQSSSADLEITTHTDNSSHYVPNAVKTYTIVVANAGPSNVTGATFTNNFNPTLNANITSWTCLATGLATCTTSGGAGDIIDVVNIPAGESITYAVFATAIGTPSGDLVNTASINSTLDVDTSTDTDILFVSSGTSNGGNIGTTQDSQIDVLPSGGSLILTLSSPITIGTHPGDDLIYYEQDLGGYIAMDWIILEVSDGSNWYTIFNWGDGSPNPGTNVNVVTTPANTADCSGEADNCNIDGAFPLADYLNNNIYSGITINIDNFGIPAGTVIRYIRITAPASDVPPDGAGIDGIYVTP
ncbi:MAG: DUF11 domain-containing protein [Anaerolineales bacterium]|nr:DUF11 domain-containing protein [Anaerolineales bacterium]